MTHKLAMRAANYRPADTLPTACGSCNYFQAEWRQCAKVAGQIETDYTCDLFEEVDLQAFETSFEIAKMDDDKNLVFGWANIAVRKDGEVVEDSQADIVSPDDLEEAAYTFNLAFRETGVMHEGESVGTLVESLAVTPEKLEKMGLEADALPLGWWVEFHIESDAVFDDVKKGKYQMFSIQGRAVREEVPSPQKRRKLRGRVK